MTEHEPFNPHSNVTADGVVIVRGLRVWTLDMVRGAVIGDDHVREYMCCSEQRTEGAHPRGQMTVEGVWFTDHGAACTENAGCRHDHWFDVETDAGRKSFNGERLSTVAQGRPA